MYSRLWDYILWTIYQVQTYNYKLEARTLKIGNNRHHFYLLTVKTVWALKQFVSVFKVHFAAHVELFHPITGQDTLSCSTLCSSQQYLNSTCPKLICYWWRVKGSNKARESSYKRHASVPHSVSSFDWYKYSDLV